MARFAHVAALSSALLLTGAILAQAQEPAACKAFKWSVAREEQALAAPNLPSLTDGSAFPGLGHGASLTLKPQAEVAYAVKSARPPKNNPAYGGQVTLADAPAGNVQVSLSSDAWVDLVQNGTVLRSTGYSGKEGCPAIRKSVRFSLAGGPVTVAVSNAPEASVKLTIVPVQ